MAFPVSPTTGKNGKVSINSGDGVLINSYGMTLQPALAFKGESFVNRIYLLGTGKTLLNMRPALEPRVDIDGIIDGLEITPGTANDTVNISAGNILVDNVVNAVSASSGVSVTRPAATQGAWVSLSVNKTTSGITATKGADGVGGNGIADLVDTYTGAGGKALVPVADLLIGFLKLTNGAALVLSSEVFNDDREWADTDAEILPNIGGVKIPTALVKSHTGSLGREVKFSGYYFDTVLAEIGTAKSWNLTPSTNVVSDSTFNRNISQTEVSGWAFGFQQLATDPKVKNIMLNHQGYGAIRLTYPNGGYWQGAATMAGTFNCQTGQLNSISVSGSLLDEPIFS